MTRPAAGSALAQRRAGPLAVRDFRLLWAGQAISTLGDQFLLVALPWLALVITGSALALGSVLATVAIPRMALMLFGGVYVDRLSPRRVMFLSNAVRLIAVTVLAVAVLGGEVGLPMLYALALVFGIADAFYFPAQQAILPALVEPEQIPSANAIVQSTTQLAVFVGPALAGILIAGLGTSGAQPSLVGIGGALVVDALSFVASLVTLSLIRGGSARSAEAEPVVGALKAGLIFVRNWPSLRMVVALAMGINLLIVGPLSVGLPVIAYTRLPEGAAAYGTIMSALGGGALLGMIVVAVLPRPAGAVLGRFVLIVMAVMGVGLAALSFVSSTIAAVAVVAVIGFGMGYGNLTLITWAQQRIPKALMGRVFSLILLGSVALVPVSQMVAGALVTLSLSGMLLGAGAAMTAFTLLAALTPTARSMGLEPVASETDEPTGAV